MKNPKIPLSIFISVVMVTTLAFYASFPWARELTGGVDPWLRLRALPTRIYWFLCPPRPSNPGPVVVRRSDPDNLIFPPSMRPYVEEFVKHRALSDPNARIIEVSRPGMSLPAIPRAQKEAFDEFMRQRALSDPNGHAPPAPLPRQERGEDANDHPGNGSAR